MINFIRARLVKAGVEVSASFLHRLVGRGEVTSALPWRSSALRSASDDVTIEAEVAAERSRVGSASAQMVVIVELVRERHLDSNLASWAALAMFPLNDNVRAGRRFRKAAKRLAGSYADELAQAPDDRIEELTVAALERLRTLATDQGEAYYRDHYGKVLSAAGDPQTPTLERTCNGCGGWFEGLEKECPTCGIERKTVPRAFATETREEYR